MANRFYDNYRPAHDGQSIMGGGMINNPKHPDVQGPYSSDWQEHVWNMARPTSTYKKGGPKHNPSLGKNNPWDGDGPTKENPAGGSSVPRKPKPSKPSGGFSLPIPTKVGQ